MEDLYPVLKMAYSDVKVISRQAGMYLCSDKGGGEHNILYVNNEISPKGIDLKSMSAGKSWVAMLYKDGTVEVIDKQSGNVLQSFNNILFISKQNIYNDKYSTLSLEPKNNGLKKVMIIDNRKANIINIYDNAICRKVDKRGKFELLLSMFDATGKKVLLGIPYSMEDVVLNHET